VSSDYNMAYQQTDDGGAQSLIASIKQLRGEIERLQETQKNSQNTVSGLKQRMMELTQQGRFGEMQQLVAEGAEANKILADTTPKLDEAKRQMNDATARLRGVVREKSQQLQETRYKHSNLKKQCMQCVEREDYSSVADLAGKLQTLKGQINELESFIREMSPFVDASAAVRWKLVLRQTIVGQSGYFFKPGEWNCNSSNPGASNYSIMDTIDQYRDENGKFMFKMRWPEQGWEQVWKQRSNPARGQRSNRVEGYEAVKVQMTDNHWGGLQPDGRNCLMSGSIYKTQWFYAIGSFAPYELNGEIGLPGPLATGCIRQVELYVGVS